MTSDPRLHLQPRRRGAYGTHVAMRAGTGRGFDDEASRLTFSERVASRCRRPAFADIVHEVIIHDLNNWIRQDKPTARKESSGRFTDVEEVRFEVEGDRLKPDGIKPVVFMESGLSAADRQAWRNWRKRVAGQLDKAE